MSLGLITYPCPKIAWWLRASRLVSALTVKWHPHTRGRPATHKRPRIAECIGAASQDRAVRTEAGHFLCGLTTAPQETYLVLQVGTADVDSPDPSVTLKVVGFVS